LLAWRRDYQQNGIGSLIGGRVGSGAGLSAGGSKPSRPSCISIANSFARTNTAAMAVLGDAKLAILLKRDYQVVYRSANSTTGLLRQCALSRQR